MKYAIYGVNRVAKDFLYIFSDLEVTCFIDDDTTRSFFCGKKILCIDDYIRINKDEKIIICDFNKQNKIEKLESYDLRYKRDFLLEEDFFNSLDELSINYDKKIIVWGTGLWAKKFLKSYYKLPIEFFVDSYSETNCFFDKDVVRPGEIRNWDDYYIVVAVQKSDEILNYLYNKGVEEKNILRFSNMNLPSLLLRETIFDKHSYDVDCITMMNHLEILGQGHTSFCCATFMNVILDSILEVPIKNIWDSVIHKIHCLSLNNKTFSFCKKNMCPLFFNKNCEMPYDIDIDYSNYLDAPGTLSLGFDPTCNLRCETCREDVYIAQGKKKEEIERISNIVSDSLLDKCNFLILAGDGEVFCSDAYKRIYRNKKTNKLKFIRILSNGTLFNEKNWRDFSNGKSGKIMLTVSIDAATKETYEAIRRNGNFDVIKKNMEFASRLRSSGELAYFRMNFVVQKRNYKEMIQFIKWGIELGADEVFFTKILNWGTFTDDEFENVSMMNKDGVTPKAELAAVLDNPLMHEKIVDLGTIIYNHNQVEDSVYNYYRWELERKVPLLFGE